MIPQNLLLAFLSLQGQDQGRSGAAPQSSQLDLNVFDSVSSTPSNYQVKAFHDVEPVRVETYDQQSVISNDQPKIHWFPVRPPSPYYFSFDEFILGDFGLTKEPSPWTIQFEKFNVGHYNDQGLQYHDQESGHVQITTNTTSFLWSLADSFPYINPKHANRNVKGAYPNPAGITINFQKNWKEVHVTLGLLGPSGFVTGKFVAGHRANKKYTQEHFTIEEKWTTWIGKAPEGGPHEGIDHINFHYGIKPHASHAEYRLVVESVTWSWDPQANLSFFFGGRGREAWWRISRNKHFIFFACAKKGGYQIFHKEWKGLVVVVAGDSQCLDEELKTVAQWMWQLKLTLSCHSLSFL